jgi:hypothetical protein
MMSPTTATARDAGGTLYVLDTHVLYEYLKGQYGFGVMAGASPDPNEALRQAIEVLLNTQRVVIPYVCLVEIIGQFFHTNIDLDNYDQWHRLRRVAFNPILNKLFDPSERIVLRTERPRIQSLNYAHLPISKELRDRLTEHYRNRKEKTLRPREPKVLDGMDAQILDDAVCVALENPAWQCELVSMDETLRLAVDDLRRSASNNPQLPKNLFFRRTYSLPGLARQWNWIRSQTP